MSFVDRQTFIDLLEKLRSEDDAEIVAAAREITRHMDEGDVDWEDLLQRQGGASERDADGEDDSDAYDGNSDDYDDGDDDGDDEVEDQESARALIQQMLENFEISDATREDLEDYQSDLDEGDFTKSDLRYVKALHTRLKASQPGKDG